MSRFSKENLVDLVHRHYNRYHRYGAVPFHLNNCSAWYSETSYDEDLDCDYVILQSYNTPVAVYIYDTNEVYRFGTWSATTVQHQWKFYRKFKAQEMISYDAEGLYLGWR